MDGDIPIVGMSNDDNNDDDDDIRHCHLVCPLFWLRTLELNISTLPLSDPLNMSTAQKNFFSHYYSIRGGGSGVVGGGGRCMRGEGKTTMGYCHWAAARDRVQKTNKFEEVVKEEDTDNDGGRNWMVLGLS